MGFCLSLLQAASGEASFSLIRMVFKGGWLMIPLFLLSIATIYLFAQKWWAFRKLNLATYDFVRQVRKLLKAGEMADAVIACQNSNTPAARMIEKGIDKADRSAAEIQAAMENVASIEVAKLEKSLPYLATIAGGAPMIGFLGTVMGMIQAFFNMAQAGANVDITLLSGGIYTAMVTTVAGLIVGILAYFGYNYLTAQVTDMVSKLEHITIDFIDTLHK